MKQETKNIRLFRRFEHISQQPKQTDLSRDKPKQTETTLNFLKKIPNILCNLGKAPSRPLQVHTPPLAKIKIEARLSGNHTSASDSRPEAIDWARGGCGDHFGLFSVSVRGQGAELEASAGQLAPLL